MLILIMWWTCGLCHPGIILSFGMELGGQLSVWDEQLVPCLAGLLGTSVLGETGGGIVPVGCKEALQQCVCWHH